MSEEICEECNEMINFSSEGITYDYTTKEDGSTVYICQECLEKLRVEAQ